MNLYLMSFPESKAIYFFIELLVFNFFMKY